MAIETASTITVDLSLGLRARKDGYRQSILRAILQTIAYADIFAFPLTAHEIHRYLIGISAAPRLVNECLDELISSTSYLIHHGNYYALSGRGELFQLRDQMKEIADQQWTKARCYGHLLAGFPFVHMVAVTGALAVNNVTPGSDLDYLIVTQPGRLWVCRAMVILLVRWASMHGDTVCPNLFLSENALSYSHQDIYTAHEMVQMIPLSGYDVYLRMMRMNSWAFDYLPNASVRIHPVPEPRQPALYRQGSRTMEAFLNSPALDWLESWEMQRKINKFKRYEEFANEADFSPDWCKGYLNSHKRSTLLAYDHQLSDLKEMVTQVY